MKMKSCVFLLSALLIFCIVTVAFANSPNVMVDDEPTNITPIIIDNRTLVSVRDVLETLGGRVSWDDELRQVSIIHGLTNVILTIDNPIAYVNGTPAILDVPPQIIDNSTKIPLRFVAESLGVYVDFKDNTIYLSTTYMAPQIILMEEPQPIIETTPSPTPKPTPEPTPQPTPEQTPEPTPEPTPQPTSTPEPSQERSGDSGSFISSPNTSAPDISSPNTSSPCTSSSSSSGFNVSCSSCR